MTRTRNKARATTPSTKSPPNPYPGVPTIHHEPRQGSHTQAPSKPRKPQHAPDGQAKEEKHRHTKATQGTEPNTPHLGWHTFVPSHTLNDTHLHTHHPTRLMLTRNNPPQPQEDTPRHRHATQPARPTGIRPNPPPAPGKPPTHRGRTPTRPRGQGKPTASNKALKPQGRTPA